MIEELRRVFARSGYDFEAMTKDADGLALFGSRACGVAREDSDWDVLLLREGASYAKISNGILGLVVVDPSAGYWRREDLAAHVLGFATWLRGEPSWTLEDLDWETIVGRKRARVERLEDKAARGVLLDPERIEEARMYLRFAELRRAAPPRALLARHLRGMGERR